MNRAILMDVLKVTTQRMDPIPQFFIPLIARLKIFLAYNAGLPLRLISKLIDEYLIFHTKTRILQICRKAKKLKTK